MTICEPILNARMYTVIFFFNDTATTEIYTLSLHDALPIYRGTDRAAAAGARAPRPPRPRRRADRSPSARLRGRGDRKSTRLNSSHLVISYAVFCLKKKNNYNTNPGWPTPHRRPLVM